MGDYLVIDYPSALALETSGVGHVVAPLAVVGGDVPWSVYYAQGERCDERLLVEARFVRALMRGMQWVLDHRASDYRDFLAKTFPRFDPDLLVRVVDTYRTHNMWTTPRIDEAAYARWQKGIADGHLTDNPIPYGDLVDVRPTGVLVDS
jgi:NitT/TauT family transport system substrate-binding protein